MNDKLAARHHEIILELITKYNLIDDAGLQIKALFGDGSDRFFYRLTNNNGQSLMVVFPSKSLAKAMEEAKSCHLIGRHLLSRQVPIPNIYHFEEELGVIVYEDLGNTLLYDIANSAESQESFRRAEILSGLESLYRLVLDKLLILQIEGAKEFIKKFCWETEFYSKELMLARESGYFLKSFCEDFIGIKHFSKGLNREFQILAERCFSQGGEYLMHRDFQSRNIMIKDGQVRFIDFQGARFGPLAYDLSSLLNDPYVNMPENVRNRLFNYYLDSLEKYISLDREVFIEGYCHISLQRNLQVLGAFSFLSQVRKKLFFKRFISIALKDLKSKMRIGPLNSEYPELAELIDNIALN